jgi:hypothetical protein
MADRLRDEREFMRSLSRKAMTNPDFRSSQNLAGQVAETDETFGFAFNWVADGQPAALCKRLGHSWERLFWGTPLKRLALRLQLLDVLLEGFEPSPALNPEYDVFISHASEDKCEFVRPLANELVELGIRVWYDEFTLVPGDSLREQIEFGLRNSKFAVVVLSPAFCSKPWTQLELNGLIARQVRGKTTIIPVWYNITIDAVTDYSPILADRVALNSENWTVEDIATHIAVIVRRSRH